MTRAYADMLHALEAEKHRVSRYGALVVVGVTDGRTTRGGAAHPNESAIEALVFENRDELEMRLEAAAACQRASIHLSKVTQEFLNSRRGVELQAQITEADRIAKEAFDRRDRAGYRPALRRWVGLFLRARIEAREAHSMDDEARELYGPGWERRL